MNNSLYSKYDRRLNLTYINKELFKGYHRSGWNYVIEKLAELHNPKGVIFDSYLDKTFGWDYDFLTINRTLPYLKPWIGVFHHTANQDYSDNNLVTSFSKPNFINSLPQCKGIITLSNSNKEWITTRLKELNVDIQVLSLTHPTEFVHPEIMFDMKTFEKNPVKKVVQIGAWLRESYSIYKLNPPEGYFKFALEGRGMGNYFISDEDIKTIERNVLPVACGRKIRTSGYMIPNKDANKYIAGLIDTVRQNHESVILLRDIDNAQYDEILKSSIAFIKLVDAAAVNTILECIVRNTPILVNRLPATEEYLGKDYPLFYDNLDHAKYLLSDLRNIKNANKYLSKMDKNKFTINYFLDKLVKSTLYRQL
jgi:hypothetical protein